MYAYAPKIFIDAFLNASPMLLKAPSTFLTIPSTFLIVPLTLLHAPLMILQNPQTFDDVPLPSKASKVTSTGRSFQYRVKNTYLLAEALEICLKPRAPEP